ncbi:MAG: hypothetical protein IPP46_02435 [Bacteroidetes bacterium]|nr:hypothetical protein [Bacteroidota bacterium]
MRLLFLSVLFLSLSSLAHSQSNPFLFLDQRPKVVVNSDTLYFPWTGGFNSITPVEIDFNGDNILIFSF